MNNKRLLGFAVTMFAIVSIGTVSLMWSREAQAAGKHYNMSPLTNVVQSSWDPLTPIPLSPDKAAALAISFANTNRAKPIAWEVKGINLVQYPPSLWSYEITLTDLHSGGSDIDVARVLLNGEIWKPYKVD